jgi:uncharacterized protein (DUF488 family)
MPGSCLPPYVPSYTWSMSDPMFTIGYQGASLERLVETLAAADVSVLVDTRETPTSRRPEFRRKSLDAALTAAGIRYLSVPALGAPRELRAVVSDWDRFAGEYRERLALVGKELQSLLPLISTERVCLLCFEADPLACHRSLLAHEIQGLLDVSTVHLRPGRVDEPNDHEGLRMSSQGPDDKV